MLQRHVGRFLLITAFLILPVGCLSTRTAAATPDYWPTGGWRASSPEKQGMDSAKLVEMLEFIHDNGRHVRNVTVIRNGYMVTDAQFHPYPPDTWHIIQSCTKSVTSTLIGIAVDKGYIEGVDVRVMDLFPDVGPDNLDNRKKRMTLKHLLSMSSGLHTRDSYLYRWQGLVKMGASPDWIKYVLDLPMMVEPGTQFEYSNCVAFLLAAILQSATKTDAIDFANEHLFNPLGISGIDWPKGPQGINLGWTGIRMKPHDMAKIGFLYLNNGRWDGEQIVSADWIENATQRQIDAGTLATAYGYAWWIDESGCFAALGYGGQYIVVCPELDLVVVFVSALVEQEFFLPRELILEYVIPACVSTSPIPENADAGAALEAIVKQAANPAASPVPGLPEIAREISGKTFEFERGQHPFRTVGFAFEDDAAVANASLAFGPKHIEVTIGLDGVFRLAESEGFLRAYRGFWEDDSTFIVDYELVDFTERGKWCLKFSGDRLTASVHDFINGDYHELTATVVE